MKIRALITRPSSKGKQLADLLEAHSGFAVCCPFIEITQGKEFDSLPQCIHGLNPDDYLIAISDNAVNYATLSLAQHASHWPRNLNYIAVGPTTAASWYDHHIPSVLTPTIHDSEGVLALLENTDLSNKNALILRGNGGRETLFEALKKQCKNVTYCEVYQRIAPKYNITELIKKWQQFEINSVIITSGEILTNLMHSIPTDALPWITNLYFIVPSQRIVQLATEFGIHHVTVAQGASNEALFDALQQLDMQIGIS